MLLTGRDGLAVNVNIAMLSIGVVVAQMFFDMKTGTVLR
jgi:hypothetical protein